MGNTKMTKHISRIKYTENCLFSRYPSGEATTSNITITIPNKTIIPLSLRTNTNIQFFVWDLPSQVAYEWSRRRTSRIFSVQTPTFFAQSRVHWFIHADR